MGRWRTQRVLGGRACGSPHIARLTALLVLVALDEHGRLAFSAESTGARSGLSGTSGDEFEAKDGPDVTYDAGTLIALGATLDDYCNRSLL